MNPAKPRHFLFAFLVCTAILIPTELRAADRKPCCDIIRVNSEKNTVWLRNPTNGLLVQFQTAPAEIGDFKVGDVFNPEKNTLNGVRIGARYAQSEADLDPPNAKIIRVRGAEVAAESLKDGTVYVFYALSFGAVLSSLKPGQEIVIDEVGRWAIIRWVSHTEASILGKRSKLKPQTYAYKLD